MKQQLEPCPFCGLPLSARPSPWLDGTPAWVVEHADEMAAARRKCPMVMGCYPTEKNAVSAANARAAVTPEQFALAVHDGEAWVRQRECSMGDAVDAISPYVCGDGYNATARAEAIVSKLAELFRAKVVDE